MDERRDEVEKVKMCKACEGTGEYSFPEGAGCTRSDGYFKCDQCNGSGEIVTELTEHELCEWAKDMIKFCEDHPFYEHSPDQQALILPDGSRLRMKEKK
jgi:hypothetical protein